MTFVRPRGWAAAGFAVLLGGCFTSGEKASIVQQPKTPAVRTVSSFSEALRCMDNLLAQHGKRDIYITSNGLPDATGRVAGGTKDMLITAVSRMSERSSAFRFVDFEPALDDVNALYWMIGVQPNFRAPSYYIRGAITQLDDAVVGEAVSAGLSLPAVDLGVSADQTISMISVDLNVGELVTRQIIPGMSSSNTLAIVASGKGADAGAVIGKAGLSFNVALNKSEGMHQAVRTLVELSTIEVLGKLTRTPYWQCLGIDQTNPAFAGEARGWFDSMSPQQRVTNVQRTLAADGYYSGPVTGQLDEATRSAISRWQADHDLIANGRIDFDLYQRMLGTPAGRGQVPPERLQTVSNAGGEDLPRAAPAPAGAGPDLVLTSDRGPKPRYRVGEALVARVTPTADGFVYCYYQDAGGAVARIYPNRFQPDAFVEANRQVEIPPGTQKPFNLRMDRVGARESIACVVTRDEIGVRLPERFKTQDLQPIPGATMPELLNAFTAVPGANARAKEMQVEVLPGAVAAR
jgi:peptidoglycan hydrolase-like protein with peptidoglycan-binding domain